MAWRRACREAGLPDRIPHDFRRTAVRSLVRSGVPTPTAMEMVGYLTMSVVRRYCIVDEADMKAASRKLAAFHRDEERTGETAAAPSDTRARRSRTIPAQSEGPSAEDQPDHHALTARVSRGVVVGSPRIELGTPGFSVLCSTN